MRSTVTILGMVLVAGFLTVPGAFGADEADNPSLARALQSAKVRLERGLTASASEGTPISAKYEIDNGTFQLSVYTMKGDAFAEVIVDHTTGKVAKVDVITDGGDLAAAQRQKEAMVKAKRSLQAATADAVKKNKGYRAVSAMPSLKEGHPVAEVTLVKGGEWRTVSEALH